MKKTKHLPSFESLDSAEWQKHWQDMPEFVQEKQEPYAKIIFRFETADDLDEFARLIGQKLTPKTKSAWFPFKSHWGDNVLRWKHEP